MSTDQVHDALKSLSQAPIEPVLQSEEEFNHVVYALLSVDKQETKGSALISEIVQAYLDGCGKVDVMQLQITAQFSADKQSFFCAVYNANGSRSVDELSLMRGGIGMTTTPYDYGTPRTFDITIPSTYSRQVQPVSSALPTFKLHVKASAGVKVMVGIFLRIHGPKISVGAFELK